MPFPHGYALLIGVGACQYSKWSLPTTVKDAGAIGAILADEALCAYPAEQIRLLHDESATRQSILDGLAWLAACAESDPGATVVVYFSGHGWLHKETGLYYLVTHDVDPFHFTASALAAATFAEALRAGAESGAPGGCSSLSIAATPRAWPPPKIQPPPRRCRPPLWKKRCPKPWPTTWRWAKDGRYSPRRGVASYRGCAPTAR